MGIAANDSECHGIEIDSVDYDKHTSKIVAVAKLMKKPRLYVSSHLDRRGVHQAQSSTGPSVPEQ